MSGDEVIEVLNHLFSSSPEAPQDDSADRSGERSGSDGPGSSAPPDAGNSMSDEPDAEGLSGDGDTLERSPGTAGGGGDLPDFPDLLLACNYAESPNVIHNVSLDVTSIA